MRRKTGLFLTIILLVGLLLFSSCTGLKINTELKKANIDFGDKESILKLEKDPSLFWLWLKWEPIKLLMIKEEKKIAKRILKIQDAEQRNLDIEKFIEWFWIRRDDNSYDSVNKRKENIYDRVVEAHTRFSDKEDIQYFRRCKYGRGWKTDMGLMYIILGEPYNKSKYDLSYLLSFLNPSYQESAFMSQEAEVWYYDLPEEYYGYFSQDGNAWILFVKDDSSYWQLVEERAFGLVYGYQNYDFRANSIRMENKSYSTYISAVYRFIDVIAKLYIYNWDLKFEDIEEKKK